MNGKIVDLPGLRLLLVGTYTSNTALDRMLNDVRDGVFPVPDADCLTANGQLESVGSAPPPRTSK